MAILNSLELLELTKSKQHGLPHLDVGGGNIDIIHGVCSALKDLDCGAILASTPSSVKDYHGYKHFVESITSISNYYDVPVSIHLDHAQSEEDIINAVEAGYSSVMYDGSHLSLDENIKNTAKIVKLSKNNGISVEGEVGIIAGKEDEIINEANKYPTFKQALRFVEETNVDFFAPAIGTAHGFYDSKPDIQWNLINDLIQIKTNFVLHGVTGLSEKNLKIFIDLGYKKFNFATGVRSEFRNGVISKIDADGTATKPQVYLKEGKLKVYEFVKNVIKKLEPNEL